MDTKIYVGNLPYNIGEEDLRSLFAQAGGVASVAIIKDRETGRSKGFAFVEMNSKADAEKAISMFNGYQLNERPLTVNMARPREEGRGGFGGRGGGGGFRDNRGRGGGGRRDQHRGGGGESNRY